MNDKHTATTGEDHREARQVERDIERTRGAIDRTLDQIGDRLHPQHLLHQVLDVFRSEDGESSEWASEARRSGKRIVRKIKRNPIPAALIGAGAAWLWLQDDKAQRRRQIRRQWEDLEEHSGSWVDARTGEPYDENYGARTSVAPAWHAGYDWSDSHEDEKSWTSKAEAALAEMQRAVGDSVRPVRERLGSVANNMVSLSGLKRSEIQRALRAQWDSTPEHSGSFVDARTGEPYDDSYGAQWRQLAAFDTLSASEASEEGEEEGWRERAEQTLSSVQAKLGDSTVSVKERLNAVGEQLSSLAQGSRSYASKYGQSSRRKMRALTRGTQQGARRLGDQIGSGYETTRGYVAETMEESPLAIGAAVLGLGFAVGAMLPSTRLEDQAVGENADAVKSRGAAAGRQAMQRGQEIASAAGEAALDEAERQGLTPSQIAERARQGAQRVGEAVKQQTPAAGDVRSRAESVAQRAKEAATQEMREQQASSGQSAGSSGQSAGSSGQSTGSSGQSTGSSGQRP